VKGLADEIVDPLLGLLFDTFVHEMFAREALEGLRAEREESVTTKPVVGSPWEVLGLRPGANRAAINTAYREKAKRAHPDAGGSHDQMARLNAARDELLRRCG
jgi:DnaJ-class molecular chaperone